ncbi:MAG: UDP-N-acetylmuramate--L-alanine ligase [Oscillospiraceae bacterium]|nr:UDP-N-acetylmuramate--L-alanine ligase [Oscillospiraceae bacterium]
MTAFDQYLRTRSKGHLIGVGGVSMSPLAEVLAGAGMPITGSDMAHSDKTAHLEELGVRVYYGHYAENIEADTKFIVRTAAVHDDNPEIIRAHEMGIPVFERAEAWGAIMTYYRNALCISGTHGKTTTTSMCTHILMAAEKDPTVMIGGTLPILKAGHRIGHGDTIVLESCEYYDSFLNFFPTVAVILNVEEDHLDYFKGGLPDIENSFHKFAESVPEDGCIVANYEDKNTMDSVAGINRKIITFGIDKNADVYADNIRFNGAKSMFDLYAGGEKITDVTLHVPGMHNIRNALAAAAASLHLGIGATAIKYGLAGFIGTGRRFEYKGKYNGADVYDDYAHHPSELQATMDAVQQLGYKRNIVVFQPHTYTRTAALFDDFVEQLKRPDITYLAEIYAAREVNTIGISSKDICREINGAKYFASFEEIVADLKKFAQPGDIILTIGAGDVYKIGEALVEK